MPPRSIRWTGRSGAILEKVKQIGREKNTLVMFLSTTARRRGDSGRLAGDPYPEENHQGLACPPATIRRRCPRRRDLPELRRALANVSNTPFRLYKSYCHEGGIAVR